MKVINHAGLANDRFSEIVREVQTHNTLSDVLAWGARQPAGKLLSQVIDVVITQDEYTHDILVPLQDGLVLVYDTT